MDFSKKVVSQGLWKERWCPVYPISPKELKNLLMLRTIAPLKVKMPNLPLSIDSHSEITQEMAY